MTPNRLAGLIYRAYAGLVAKQTARRRLLRKFPVALLQAARAVLLRRDPIVSVPVGKRELLMHLSHPLPLYMACVPTYDRTLPRIAAALERKHGRVVAIDVGANIGDSAALLTDAVPAAQILCIEGSATYFPLLIANVARLSIRAECLQTYCGDEATASVTVLEHGGTGRLVAGGTPVPTRTVDEIVDAHPRFASTNLLKVDTDGFDFRVLRGAQRLLRDAQPLVYFELVPDLLRAAGEDPLSIFPLLVSLGYMRGVFYANTGEEIGPFSIDDTDAIRRRFADIDHKNIFYFDVLALPESERV